MLPTTGASPEKVAKQRADGDAGYFTGYSALSIHEVMLKDRNRTLAYKKAIQDCGGLFKDKIVVDVGCGTGILSIFAAQAGAKHVYGIDASDAADMAKVVVAQNGLSDVITIIKGKVEEIECLPGLDGSEAAPVEAEEGAAASAGGGDAGASKKKSASASGKSKRIGDGCVDIIVSEWMGYFLIYECMMATVAHARDRWLKSDGHMYPTEANLHMAPVSDAAFFQNRAGSWWDDVYGVSLSCLKRNAAKEFLSEPAVRDIEPSILMPTAPVRILHMDCAKVKGRKVDRFESNFTFTVAPSAAGAAHDAAGEGGGEGGDGMVTVHGFATWFDVSFPALVDGAVGLGTVLDTAPGVGDLGQQHWRQTMFYLQEPITVPAGSEITGQIFVTPHPDYHRGNDIVLMFKHASEDPAAREAGALVSKTVMYEFA